LIPEEGSLILVNDGDDDTLPLSRDVARRPNSWASS